MNRIDRLLTRRILLRMLSVVAIFFTIIMLAESLDTGKFNDLAASQGQAAALLQVIASAGRWSIKTLPVTVLIGGIVALIALQSHRELLVIKAGGLSIWQILRGPTVALFVASALVATVVDAQVTILNRSILPAPQAAHSTAGGDQIWLEQTDGDSRFIVQAARALPDRVSLAQVTVFLGPNYPIRRIVAETAHLANKEWTFRNATLFRANRGAETAEAVTLGTDSDAAELQLKLSSTEDFTFFELAAALASGVSDPATRAAATTRYIKLISMPLLLVGTLLIAFAFGAGYRRTSSYGSAIVYGILLGFVVFVTNEMADRAGSAGVLEPTLAAWGPAIVAIVMGLTLLLYKEDGRA